MLGSTPIEEETGMRTLKKLLVLAGLGVAVAAIAKKLQGGGSEPVWQSADEA